MFSREIGISVWVIILLLVGLGVYNTFIQDDAFITFRYSQHLAQGYGAVWNLHDDIRVAGYTDPLWMLLIALAYKFGIEPTISSSILGLLFGAITLIYTYRLSLFITESKYISLLTIVLLGTNYTFSSYMTGGLETQIQTALINTSLYYTLIYTAVSAKYREWISLSILYALAILTRLDSIIFVGIMYIYLIYMHYTHSGFKSIKRLFLPITAPVFIATLSLLAVNQLYYSDPLPNTFYVKATGLSYEVIDRGVFYIKSFFNSYMLTPFILLLFWYRREIFAHRGTKLILAIVLVWILYVIKVGGGFMEYRFMVPIMPMIYTLIALSIASIPYKIFRYMLISLLIISSIYHAKGFSHERGIESFDWLQGHLYVASSDWVGIGKRLRATLNPTGDSNITIAVTAAGAIPYYSRLETIDMLGLNDRWIAKHGKHINMKVGHDKYATLEYLINRGVNIVIGHPKMIPIRSKPVTDPLRYFWYKPDISKLPDDISILELPINREYKIEMLYIKEHPDIERSIEKGLISKILIKDRGRD